MRVIQANNTEMINIGRQLENLATEVVFDLSNWIAEFGDGAAALIVRRVGDSNDYPVSLERQGSKATWKVTNADTELAQKGRYGRCELRWYVGDVLAKSHIWKLYVEPSMVGQSSVFPPSPEQSWFNKVLEAGTVAENAATNAEDSASEAAASATAAKASEEAANASETAAKASETAADESAYAAQRAANEAKVDADTVATLAEEVAAKAIQTANNATLSAQAKEAAQTAQRLAEAAQQAAETARTAANAAQVAAEQSATDAAGAKRDAETAMESAQDAAAAAAKALTDIQALYQEMQTWANSAIQSINNAGSTAVQSVQSAGNSQVQRVTVEGTTQTANAKAQADAAAMYAESAQAAKEALEQSIVENPGSIVIDPTLSIVGAAAEAASVGKIKQDVAAITPDDSAVNGKPWTSKKIVDSLCQPFEESGNPVQCYPVKNYPLGVKVHIEPTQEGSGDPSPDNIRPITGRDTVSVTRCGKNLFDLGTEYDGQWYGNHPSVTEYASIDGDSFNFQCATQGVSWAIRLKKVKVTQQMRYKFNYTVNNTTGEISSRVIIRCFNRAGQIIRDSSALSGSAYNTYYNANVITQNRASLVFSSDVEFAYFGFAVFSSSNEDIGKRVSVNNVLLEYGPAQTSYEPYTGSTTDIALPETVYGGELDVETGVLTVTHGNIAAYAGESIPGKWISDRDIYAQGATPTDGAHVVYELKAPYTIQLTPQQITALSGVNTTYTDANGVIVTGAEDPKHTITELKNAIISLGGNV